MCPYCLAWFDVAEGLAVIGSWVGDADKIGTHRGSGMWDAFSGLLVSRKFSNNKNGEVCGLSTALRPGDRRIKVHDVAVMASLPLAF